MEDVKKPKILKKITIAVIIFLAFFIPFKFYAHYLASLEYPQKEQIKNPDKPNGKKILIVYQPSGKTNYMEELANNIADGAVEKGAKVTIIRPNKNTRININEYDIFIFGTPWYLEPSPRLIEFIKNMGNLSGKKVYLFISQGGNYPAPWRFNPLKKAVNGTPIEGQMSFVHYFYWKSAIPKELKKAKAWGSKIGSS